jgi:hypothetical protein
MGPGDGPNAFIMILSASFPVMEPNCTFRHGCDDPKLQL